MIIQALNARQKVRGGYLTKDDLHRVAEELNVELHRVEALVTFFPHYRTTPPPKVEVHVCRDMSCHLRGSAHVIEQLQKWAEKNHGHDVHVSGVSCLGRCDRAPAALINEQLYVLRKADELQAIAASHLTDKPTAPDSDTAYAKSKARTWEIECYGAGPAKYSAVEAYLKNPEPDSVLKALENAGLLGMGGAGGRTYLKWRDVYEARSSNGDKYLVCNADESEPGTFKDRDLLVLAPHLTIEGMILGGLVVGAKQGWVYIRHEYPEQAESVEREIKRAESIGALGDNIFGSGRSFKLEVFVSPGNYICGEQTALIEAMEDKRAEPRIRPPELMTNGYLNQPTLLNNVETYAWVPAIMLRSSGQWYAERGQKTGPLVGENSELIRGMRFFSISGDVAKPGVYEVPTGITLGDLIDKHCGGMAPGKEIVAVALSGPSGGLLPPKIPVSALSRRFVEKHVPKDVKEIDVRDLPLDINVARALDVMVGAGMVVYGTGADVLGEALALSRFFRNESCGKCVPCRIGSQKITEMGERLSEGKIAQTELPTITALAAELSNVMRATSICGLGQVASNPMRTLLAYFPERVQAACNQTKTSSSVGGAKDNKK